MQNIINSEILSKQSKKPLQLKKFIGNTFGMWVIEH